MVGKRKYEPVTCPKCGEEYGATYMRYHLKLCTGGEQNVGTASGKRRKGGNE